VRPSGTEPAVRVMVEATEHEHAQRLAEDLAATIRSL
jgi:phosphoglucosamine mutase